MQQANAANPQQRLLAQPVVAIPAIKTVSQRPVARVVLLQVAVQKINRDRVSGNSLYVITPGTDRDPPAFQIDHDNRVFGNELFLRLPRLLRLALYAIRSEEHT